MTLVLEHFKDEDELKAALSDTPEALDEGLRILGREIRTDSGAMDLLGVDRNGQLVVIEAKDEEASGAALVQILRYIDYVDRFKSSYKVIAQQNKGSPKIADTTSPRGIIVAPAFAHELRRALRFVLPDIVDLYEALCLEDRDTRARHILCRVLPREKELKQPDIPTSDKLFSRIEDDDLRETAQQVYDWAKAMSGDIEARMRPDGIGLRSKKMFAYLWPRKKSLLLETRIQDDWEKTPIKRPEDWTNEVKNKIRSSLALAGGATDEAYHEPAEDVEEP